MNALQNVGIPNYEEFREVNEAYCDFEGKFLRIINQIAPMKTTKVKNNTQDWFGQEIKEKIAL